MYKNINLLNRSEMKILRILLALSTTIGILTVSCKKLEEPPTKVGAQLPYSGATKTLSQVLDSIPEASLYKAMYHRSDIQHYMDSLASGSQYVPYTLFVPTDKALTAAGYTANIIAAAPEAQLDTLVRYLTLPGNYLAQGITTGLTCYPLMYPDPHMQRSESYPPFYSYTPYYYILAVTFDANTLILNGNKVSNQGTPVPAINGSVYLIDTLIQKPNYELYEIVASDTTLSLFLAGMRLNDSIYQDKGILMYPGYFTNFNDTAALQLSANGFPGAGNNPFANILAPTNEAFRKAGLGSVDAIRDFISQSVICGPDYDYSFMQTNLDSIFQHHVFLFSQTIGIPVPFNIDAYSPMGNYVYTYDMVKNPTLLQRPYVSSDGKLNHLYNVVFESRGGQVVVHRADNLSSMANIIGPSNVTTLNGVLHYVDNLLK
jgi:hypothetical protein